MTFEKKIELDWIEFVLELVRKVKRGMLVSIDLAFLKELHLLWRKGQ